MGRAPCCSKVGLHRGPWAAKEDALLTDFIQTHGEGNWRSLPKRAGLLRCGKSCRLRWMNYLRPDIKRGNINEDEEDLIIRLHSLLGNRWSLIAGRLPGRTDNEIKNYWNSHLVKKLKRQGIQVIEGSTRKACSKVSQRKNTEKKERKKKKKKNNKKSVLVVEVAEFERTTIHAPKPTRLRPSTSSNIAMDSWGSSKGDHDICWNDFNQEANLVFDSGFYYEDRMLEEVYQEYSQLLISDDGYELPIAPYVDSYIFPMMSN